MKLIIFIFRRNILQSLTAFLSRMLTVNWWKPRVNKIVLLFIRDARQYTQSIITNYLRIFYLPRQSFLSAILIGNVF